MNSEREWIRSCLHGQQDVWAEWLRIGERLADNQEASGWGTPYALRLLNEQNARWLEATQHWLREWEHLAHAYPGLGFGERQALMRNRIFQTWLDTASGLDWDQWHLSMRQAFLLLQQAFQAAQALQTAPVAALMPAPAGGQDADADAAALADVGLSAPAADGVDPQPADSSVATARVA